MGLKISSDSGVVTLGEALHSKMEAYKVLFKKITDHDSKYFKKFFVKKPLILYNSSHGTLIADKLEDKIPPEVSKFLDENPS